jgi:hypothetical protein
MRSLALLCVGGSFVAAAGCNSQAHDGLPPATEWQADPPTMPSRATAPRTAQARGMGANPHAGLNMGGVDSSDPHAGVDMSDPHAGVDMSGAGGRDPHAGLDMSGGGADPHAGLDMSGTDVTKMGLAAPDPNRDIDPSRRVAGMVAADAKAKDKLKPGTSVFIIVKRAGADGAPSGPALAVDKLTWSGGSVPFELTDANAMVAGTQLTGDVIITARYDQDSDALSKEPGDVTGQVRVKVPADKVKLVLDTVLP